MDRDAIERRDFPVERKGYDPGAVHAHLRAIADEIEGLRARPAAPLAAGTSEQVRLILEAAETSAAQIRGQAGEHVARVEQAAGGMLSRLDELERELGALLEALRRSGQQLSDGLARLQADVAGVAEPAPAAPAAPEEPPAPLDGDEAGARLTALNMALGGTPREETARYLAEHYAVADPEALLDDVYNRAGG